MVLVNPVWQGGGDLNTLEGANELENLYLQQVKYSETHVLRNNRSGKRVENQIQGYTILRGQLHETLSLLRTEEPIRLFTIGGGCDADLASILYMNESCGETLSLLWLDAHGDLNAPEESNTELFYGMVARAALGGCPKMTDDIGARLLKPSQYTLIGGRDLDAPEKRFISNNNIRILSEKCDAAELTDVLKNVKNLYIHLDLDVLDPKYCSYTPVPVENGMAPANLLKLLKELRSRCNVIGFGLFEYIPCGEKKNLMQELINYGLSVAKDK